MAAVTSHRLLIFSGARDGVPFLEFVTNFHIAIKGTNMTEDQKKSAFFSHFDGKALSHLHNHLELLDKPLDEAIKELTKYYVGDKPFCLTKLGGMHQLQNETVRDYLQRLFEAATPTNSKKDPPADMTPDQKLIWDAQKEAQQQQLQEMVKPFFVNGMRSELRQQLGIVYGLGLKDMARELGKFEVFQKDYPLDKKPSFAGVAMVECKEPEETEKPVREEIDREELAKQLERWWIDKTKSTEKQAKEWIHQTENNIIPKRTSRPFKKKVQFDRSVARNNVNQVSATGAANATPAAGITQETMQRAAEMLTALNPPQPTVGLLPTPPAYNMIPYTQNQPFPPNQGNWGMAQPWGYHNQQVSDFNNFNAGNFNNPRPSFNRNYGERTQPSNSRPPTWRNGEELQYCTYCKKNIGHPRQYCRKRMRDEHEAQRRLLDQADGQQYTERVNYTNGNTNRPNKEFQKRLPAPEQRKAIEAAPSTSEGQQPNKPVPNREGQSNNLQRSNRNDNQSKNGERRPPPRR
jgi:hypothetical protein